MIVVKRVLQFVLVVDRDWFSHAMLADQIVNLFDVRITLVTRHVNADHVQPLVLLFVAPLRDARQVVLANAAARRPEMHERRTALGLSFCCCLGSTEPLGRPIKPGHLCSNLHRHCSSPTENPCSPKRRTQGEHGSEMKALSSRSSDP